MHRNPIRSQMPPLPPLPPFYFTIVRFILHAFTLDFNCVPPRWAVLCIQVYLQCRRSPLQWCVRTNRALNEIDTWLWCRP
uniref:Uncharacterized protein n=1 Tax=Physcomitrium patens TaxID=3218 RepID=A0A2K1J0D3_PHYPA|nr:hypothetical protein PHYPA_022880 [Physcomitrium patens]